jgi:hypothetical protein
MNVLTKFTRIPTAAKIALALGATALLGVAAYLVVGPEAAALGGVGGFIVSIFGLGKHRRRQTPGSVELAGEQLDHVKQDADRETGEAVSTGRASISAHTAELEADAVDTARNRDLGSTLRALGRESEAED